MGSRKPILYDSDAELKDDTTTKETKRSKSQKNIESGTDDETHAPPKEKLKSRIGRKITPDTRSSRDTPHNESGDSEDSLSRITSQIGGRKSIHSKISRKSPTPEETPRKT